LRPLSARPSWRTSTPTNLGRYFAFGRVEKIDTLDGLRVWFDSGDIAHLRASGNAPQLRIYAVAGSQARADEIVTLGLRDILPALEKAVS